MKRSKRERSLIRKNENSSKNKSELKDQSLNIEENKNDLYEEKESQESKVKPYTRITRSKKITKEDENEFESLEAPIHGNI